MPNFDDFADGAEGGDIFIGVFWKITEVCLHDRKRDLPDSK